MAPFLGVILDLEPHSVGFADLYGAARQQQQRAELLGFELPGGGPFVAALLVGVEGGFGRSDLAKPPLYRGEGVILGIVEGLGIEEEGVGREILRPGVDNRRGRGNPGPVSF